MTIAVRTPGDTNAVDLRQAMRHLVGGVSVITAGIGADRTGLTATSATALSMEPPTLLIRINRAASASADLRGLARDCLLILAGKSGRMAGASPRHPAEPVIRRHGHFAVTILSAAQQAVAERFAGGGGAKGAARYEGAAWRELPSGAAGLEDALAVVACSVEEIIERHGIVLGGVVSVTLGTGAARRALVYGHGRFAPWRLPDGDGAAATSPS